MEGLDGTRQILLEPLLDEFQNGVVHFLGVGPYEAMRCTLHGDEFCLPMFRDPHSSDFNRSAFVSGAVDDERWDIDFVMIGANIGDPIDLQQAFGDFKIDVTGGADHPEYLIVRGGRFEMSLGDGRLVATRAAPNIPFKFDGLELIGAADDAHIYAFITKPGREKQYEIADEFPSQLFWGVYVTTPILWKAMDLRADVYSLGFQDNDSVYANVRGAEQRYTFGTRLFGKANGFDYDVEPIIQTGRIDDRQILAWTVGSSVLT